MQEMPAEMTGRRYEVPQGLPAGAGVPSPKE